MTPTNCHPERSEGSRWHSDSGRDTSSRLSSGLRMTGGIKNLWNKWKHIAEKIALFQTRVILTVFYFTIFLPAGLVFSLFKDALKIKTIPKTSWIAKDKQVETIEEMRKQY